MYLGVTWVFCAIFTSLFEYYTALESAILPSKNYTASTGESQTLAILHPGTQSDQAQSRGDQSSGLDHRPGVGGERRAGGHIVVQGTPEQMAGVGESWTGWIELLCGDLFN